jgi:hypothetical protein
MAKRIRRHWLQIAWQLPIFLPFVLLAVLLASVAAAFGFTGELLLCAANSINARLDRLAAGLPPMFTRFHSDD